MYKTDNITTFQECKREKIQTTIKENKDKSCKRKLKEKNTTILKLEEKIGELKKLNNKLELLIEQKDIEIQQKEEFISKNLKVKRIVEKIEKQILS